jgi:hypothetical protein
MGRWTDVPNAIEVGTMQVLRKLQAVGEVLTDEYLRGMVAGAAGDLIGRVPADEWLEMTEMTHSDFKRLRDAIAQEEARR